MSPKQVAFLIETGVIHPNARSTTRRAKGAGGSKQTKHLKPMAGRVRGKGMTHNKRVIRTGHSHTITKGLTHSKHKH